jgi:hypothetical protein
MKYPNHITSLAMHNLNDSQAEINGKWQPARPLPFYGGLFRRIKLSWWVFTGKADALTWPNQ